MIDTTQTLSAYDTLIAEHREMESFLDTLESLLVDATDITALGAILGRIDAHINTHFACEEKGLFPVLEKYHPMVLMEAEHEEIVALRDEVMAHFHQQSLSELKQQGAFLIKELRDHIAREDGGIFPAAERSLKPEEKEQVILKMATIREAARTVPVQPIARANRYFEPFTLPPERPFDRPVNVKKLLEADGTTVKELAIRAGDALAEHWTPHPVVLYCLSGKARFESNGKTRPVGPGDGLYFSPQLKHGLFAETDSRFLLVFLPKAESGLHQG